MRKKLSILVLVGSLLLLFSACGEEDDVFYGKDALSTDVSTEIIESIETAETIEIETASVFETNESTFTETFDSESGVFSLNGLQTDLTNLADSIAAQSNDFIGAFSDSVLPVIDSEAALLAAQYLSSGHCWISCADSQAVILFIDGLALQMETISYDGLEFLKEEITANWYMTAGDLILVNAAGQALDDFSWTFENEESLNVFTITDSNNHSYTFYELEEESIEEGELMAESFLTNEKTFEEVSDYSSVLVGYTGVSIVDAFVQAGLNPSFENRAVFAKELGIENYKGTAEQNLSLIKLMGGTVK